LRGTRKPAGGFPFDERSAGSVTYLTTRGVTSAEAPRDAREVVEAAGWDAEPLPDDAMTEISVDFSNSLKSKTRSIKRN
jgi:hypothetical protein